MEGADSPCARAHGAITAGRICPIPTSYMPEIGYFLRLRTPKRDSTSMRIVKHSLYHSQIKALDYDVVIVEPIAYVNLLVWFPGSVRSAEMQSMPRSIYAATSKNSQGFAWRSPSAELPIVR
jgi:hypothetical protein